MSEVDLLMLEDPAQVADGPGEQLALRVDGVPHGDRAGQPELQRDGGAHHGGRIDTTHEQDRHSAP